MSIPSWQDFSFTAKQSLHRSNHLDHSGGFITFIYEPSFENPFRLDLIFKNDICLWEKAVWDKSMDAQKFEVINSLRYIGQPVIPTIVRLSGHFPIARITPLFDKIRSMSLPILIENDEWIVLDGEANTLITGNNNWEQTYKWTTLPEPWQALAGVQQSLLKLFAEQT